jgi:hypothetical protein
MATLVTPERERNGLRDKYRKVATRAGDNVRNRPLLSSAKPAELIQSISLGMAFYFVQAAPPTSMTAGQSPQDEIEGSSVPPPITSFGD